MPHKAVRREIAQTTKVQGVHDDDSKTLTLLLEIDGVSFFSF